MGDICSSKDNSGAYDEVTNITPDINSDWDDIASDDVYGADENQTTVQEKDDGPRGSVTYSSEASGGEKENLSNSVNGPGNITEDNVETGNANHTNKEQIITIKRPEEDPFIGTDYSEKDVLSKKRRAFSLDMKQFIDMTT